MVKRLSWIALVMVAACQSKGPASTGDCQAVGEHAAAFELGNYAPPEERAPTIARMVERCRSAGIDAKQAACVIAAKDTWTAAACAPKLFPDVKVGGDCDQLASRMGAELSVQMGSSSDPKIRSMVERMIGSVRSSCEQDGWPPALKACALAAPEMLKGMNACEHLVPPALQQKLQARMATAMQGM